MGHQELMWKSSLTAGKDVILEIEIQGALKVKKKFPETLLLFVTPPSAEELRKRLDRTWYRDHGSYRTADAESHRRIRWDGIV